MDWCDFVDKCFMRYEGHEEDYKAYLTYTGMVLFRSDNYSPIYSDSSLPIRSKEHLYCGICNCELPLKNNNTFIDILHKETLGKHYQEHIDTGDK